MTFTPLDEIATRAVERWRSAGVEGGYTHLKEAAELGMGRRIAITGGAGCLGSNLTERYLEAGDDVLVIDNFATGHRGSLPEHPRLTLVEGTIADHNLVARAFADFMPTHVIHSAASYKDPDNWLEDVHTNVEGTINVVVAAKATNVKRVVNFHTALGYGRPDCSSDSGDCVRTSVHAATALASRPGRAISPFQTFPLSVFALPTSLGRDSRSDPSRLFTLASRPASPAFVPARSAISSTWKTS